MVLTLPASDMSKLVVIAATDRKGFAVRSIIKLLEHPIAKVCGHLLEKHPELDLDDALTHAFERDKAAQHKFEEFQALFNKYRRDGRLGKQERARFIQLGKEVVKGI